MSTRRLHFALLCAFTTACGESSRVVAPTPPPPPGWAAGTVLTVVSGSDEQPVAGARVILPAGTLTTDASGRVTLNALSADSGLMDVVAAGYIDRQTVVRSSEGTRIVLWPKETASGVTEHTTAELVYTPGSACCPATDLARSALHRIAPTIPALSVVLAADYRNRARTVAALQEAAALASGATGGRVNFSVAEAATGPHIDVTYGTDPLDRPQVAAFADRTFNSAGYITGGRVVVVDEDILTEGYRYVDTVAILSHELGHMLGLEHTSSPGVMNSTVDLYFYFRAQNDYSPMERETLRLMAARRALNRFPDNDRAATTATSPPSDR